MKHYLHLKHEKIIVEFDDEEKKFLLYTPLDPAFDLSEEDASVGNENWASAENTEKCENCKLIKNACVRHTKHSSKPFEDIN